MIVELEDQGAEAIKTLREQAAAREMTLDAYLKLLADAGGNGPSETPMSLAELDRSLDELSSGKTLPILPVHFSRADIYAEHD